MKKVTSIFFAFIFAATIFCVGTGFALPQNFPYTVIDRQIGNVVSVNEKSEILLKGKYRNKSPFATEIVVEVYDLEKKLIATIRPKNDSGYFPKMLLQKFDKSGLDYIFLGTESGGSGGYGSYYLYTASNGSARTLFDDELFSSTNIYTAKYCDNFVVQVIKNSDKMTYLVDLSLRDKEYLNQIYFANGTLKKPTTADVGAVNTVFPYYNNVAGYFQLQVLQRITGLYNADSLGYISSRLTLEKETFKNYFTTLEIFGVEKNRK